VSIVFRRIIIEEEKAMGSSDELMSDALERASDERVAKYLGLTFEEWEDLQVELQEETSNDDATLSFYFEVPEDISDEVAEKLGHAPGDTVYLPLSLFNEPDAPEEP
jgi:hypothetical protein